MVGERQAAAASAPEENRRREGTRYPSPKKCLELRNNALNVRLRLEADGNGRERGRAESNEKYVSLRRPEKLRTREGGSEGEVGAQLHN